MTKALYSFGKVKNKLTTLPARLTRGYYESRGNLGKRAIADLRVKEGTKSKTQLKKEAVKLGGKFDKVVEKVRYQNPSKTIGEAVEKGTIEIGKRPVESIIWGGTSFLPVPSTIMAASGGKAIKKVFPNYGKKYASKKRHPVPEFLGKAARAGSEYVQTLPL